MKSKLVISLGLILCLSVAASLPLIKSGLFTIHDDQQIARLFVFDEAIRNGQILPRWVGSLGFGFGYPLFVFYPPLVYYIGELFHLVGFSLVDSIKIVFFLSILLSGISIFILTKYLFGTFSATVASIFYILVPYRALDIYVRGALAEAFSFVWPPLILWSLLKLRDQSNPRTAIVCSVFIALLMLTHNLILLPFSMIIVIFTLYLVTTTPRKKEFVTFALGSFGLAAALSAFFWAPALLEKKHTIVDELLIVNLASYKIHFVYPTQLWNWTWGFGGSSEGIMDGISFKIGKLHAVVSSAAFLISTLLLFFVKKMNKDSKKTLSLVTSFFLLFALSAFMTTHFSKPVWDLIKPLAYLQFPWRFLEFTALFSSILAAAFIYLMRISILRFLFASLFIAILLITNLKLFKPQYYRANLDDKNATTSDLVSWEVSSSSFEYIPRGVELIKNEKGANTLNIAKNEIPNTEIVTSAQISNLTKRPDRLSFTVNNLGSTKIMVNTFNFPGWHLYVNGVEKQINSDNKFKLISFDLDAGVHEVVVDFKETPTRLFSNLTSIVSFFGILVYLSTRWLKKLTI